MCVVLNIVFVDLLVGVGYLYFNILVDYNYLDDELIGIVFFCLLLLCCLVIFLFIGDV